MVVVGHEFPQYALGMAFAANEHPVQALGPGCEHEPFSERVRPGRSEGCLDDLGTDRSHHLVKGANELAVTVTDKVAKIAALGFECGD